MLLARLPLSGVRVLVWSAAEAVMPCWKRRRRRRRRRRRQQRTQHGHCLSNIIRGESRAPILHTVSRKF